MLGSGEDPHEPTFIVLILDMAVARTEMSPEKLSKSSTAEKERQSAGKPGAQANAAAGNLKTQ